MTFLTDCLGGRIKFSADVAEVGEEGFVGWYGKDVPGQFLCLGGVIVCSELELLLIGMKVGEIVQREVGFCVWVWFDFEHGSTCGFALDVAQLDNLKRVGRENIFC